MRVKGPSSLIHHGKVIPPWAEVEVGDSDGESLIRKSGFERVLDAPSRPPASAEAETKASPATKPPARPTAWKRASRG